MNKENIFNIDKCCRKLLILISNTDDIVTKEYMDISLRKIVAEEMSESNDYKKIIQLKDKLNLYKNLGYKHGSIEYDNTYGEYIKNRGVYNDKIDDMVVQAKSLFNNKYYSDYKKLSHKKEEDLSLRRKLVLSEIESAVNNNLQQQVVYKDLEIMEGNFIKGRQEEEESYKKYIYFKDKYEKLQKEDTRKESWFHGLVEKFSSVKKDTELLKAKNLMEKYNKVYFELRSRNNDLQRRILENQTKCDNISSKIREAVISEYIKKHSNLTAEITNILIKPVKNTSMAYKNANKNNKISRI